MLLLSLATPPPPGIRHRMQKTNPGSGCGDSSASPPLMLNGVRIEHPRVLTAASKQMTEAGVDQNLYSRQIGVFGMETYVLLLCMFVRGEADGVSEWASSSSWMCSSWACKA